MKIIYRGGYNSTSEESIRASFWYEYEKFIEDKISSGSQVAVITLAKPDGTYQELLARLPKEVIVIDTKSQSLNWSSLDFIFIPGGNSFELHTGLKQSKFELDKLKDNAWILGDSAGAYVLSSYFYDSPPGDERGKEIEFYEGFNPASKNITIAHTNNPHFYNQLLLEKVNNLAEQYGLSVLMLKENEEKSIDI